MSDNINDIFMNILNHAIEDQQRHNRWKSDSRFARARTDLQADSRGQIGEEFVAKILTLLGHEIKNTQVVDPQNKQWDLVVGDKYCWEIKTATMGKKTSNFQHEHIYKERGYHGIIFVDIAPDDLYVSFVAKHEIVWKNLHRRKDSNFYKWDFSMSKIEDNIIKTLSDFQKGYAAAVVKIDAHLQTLKNPHDI